MNSIYKKDLYSKSQKILYSYDTFNHNMFSDVTMEITI